MPKERKVIDTDKLKINNVELEPGEIIPFHVHKATKYDYIVKGSLIIGERKYLPGEIIENLIGSGHSPKAGKDGCEFLVIWCVVG